MIDQALLGSTVSKLMDTIEEDTPGEGDNEGELTIEAVGIVVVVGDGSATWTRTFSSHTRRFEQLGIFASALECCKHGE